MLFDTHCHLNFEAFDKKVDDVIERARKVGVNQILIPGTDIPTSKKAVQIAEKHEGIYAAVGIHPHHIMQYQISNIKYQNNTSNIKQDVIPAPDRSRGQAPAGIQTKITKQKSDYRLDPLLRGDDIEAIEKLLSHPKVVAIGEVGIDRHIYQKTVYNVPKVHKVYKVDEEFVELQKIFLTEQIKLAHKYKKSLILHNREAKQDVIDILSNYGLRITDYRSVFHCCEPDLELLAFAKDHKMFIGVDGDITYYKEKQEWIKSVPLDMLVLETDSPFLNPEPNRSKEGGTKNEPKNIPMIAEFIARLKNVSINRLIDTTTENAKKLFKVSP